MHLGIHALVKQSSSEGINIAYVMPIETGYVGSRSLDKTTFRDSFDRRKTFKTFVFFFIIKLRPLKN